MRNGPPALILDPSGERQGHEDQDGHYAAAALPEGRAGCGAGAWRQPCTDDLGMGFHSGRWKTCQTRTPPQSITVPTKR